MEERKLDPSRKNFYFFFFFTRSEPIVSIGKYLVSILVEEWRSKEGKPYGLTFYKKCEFSHVKIAH